MIPAISLLVHNWKAKLGSLALATVLWLVIRHSIGYAPSVPPTATPPLSETSPHQ